MARFKKEENPYHEEIIDGMRCVVFETVGKEQHQVIVDSDIWYQYLNHYSWTAIKNGTRINVKSSIKKQSICIWRVIVEHEYSELDYWGTTIDHINNNPLDNRLKNLRIFNTSILNSTNISSKYSESDMQYIHRQGSKDKTNGYKVHYNLAGKTYYKNFSVKEYGSTQEAIKAAKKYRDEFVIPEREKIIIEMMRKTRSIEFEIGLRDMLNAGEFDEVIKILRKYNVV